MNSSFAPVAAALTLVMIVGSGAWAGSPTEDLRGFFAAAGRILDGPEAEDTPGQRLIAIRAITAEIFDFSGAARLSLGHDWNARTPAERAEFVGLFADLIERSFIMAVASRVRLSEAVKVRYLGESRDGDVATVRTTISSKTGAELPFDYRMIERGDRWAIRDVVVDGVSLAANYRAQFSRVIHISSFSELVELIRAKLSAAPYELLRRQITETTERAPGDRPPDVSDAAPDASLRSAEPEPSPLPAMTLKEPEPATIDPPTADQDERASTESDRPARRPAQNPAHEPPAASATPVSAPAVTTGPYWIQIGAFKNAESARSLASLLNAQESRTAGRFTVIVHPGPAGTAFSRVRVGPFQSRAAAAVTLREFQTRGYTPFVADDRADP